MKDNMEENMSSDKEDKMESMKKKMMAPKKRSKKTLPKGKLPFRLGRVNYKRREK